MDFKALSVVISCCNEKQMLETTVKRVPATCRKDLGSETVIINGSSSMEVIKGLAERHPEVTRHSHPFKQGKGTALRSGFEQAKGGDVVENRSKITTKASRIRPCPCIYEMGIFYFYRTYENGKKIGRKNNACASYSIIHYNFFLRPDGQPET